MSAPGTGTAGLAVYDSLRREPRPLAPPDGRLNIYSCGPLVLNRIHLGHLRQYLNVDSLKRAALAQGCQVRQVLTLTDVARHSSAEQVAQAGPITAGFFDDLAALSILPPDVTPRLSEHIELIVGAARRLEQLDRAYRTPAGLYFDTAASPGYGRLSGLTAEAQLPGHRIARDFDALRSPTDFAVWRLVDPATDRGWDSPWGFGIPGWHIPCTAMATHYLDRIDVHSGVEHHRRLHHVNELAQAEALTPERQPWVECWHHTADLTTAGGRLTRAGETRAPSLADVLATGAAAADVRYVMLGGHYRQRLDLDDAGLRAASRARTRLRARIAGKALPPPRSRPTVEAVRQVIGTGVGKRYLDLIDSALCRDVNTARLLALVHQLAKDPTVPAHQEADLWALLTAVLGLSFTEPESPDPLAVSPHA
ncbi:MAG TPA: hypothetical protein VMB79_18040 [Jatrophihabitans sp.]|nr:hypothetical protein [Jatrophihabitans sp.]